MDTILINGKVLKDDGTFVEAIAIKDGYISALGNNEEITELKCSDTKVIDVDGKLVIPGLNDSHIHLYNLGAFLSALNLYGVTSIEEIISKSKGYIASNSFKENQTIIGRGWNQDYFTDAKRLLNRHDLDRITTECPLYFKRACGHVTVCNTKALEVAGVTSDTSQVAGGVFEIGSDGKPNGIFNENAQSLLQCLLPEVSLEMVKDYLRLAFRHAISNGLTSVQTNDFTYGSPECTYILEAYKELLESNEVPLRIYLQCCFDEPRSFKEFIDTGYYTGYGNDRFKIGPLKLFVDGSLGARTSLMRNEYNDDRTTKGVACMKQEQLNELVEIADNNKFQVIVHAIGDEGINQALNSYERIYNPHTNNQLRHGINHCQITDIELLKRFKSSNSIAYVQPIFLHYDLHIVEDRVGKELASTSYAFKTMHDLGIHVAYGTDAPVEDLNPFECMYCAVTRKDLSGYPNNGFYTDECVTINEAINAYTIGSAYSSFEENIKGTLEVGKLADIVVVDRDLYAVDSGEIKDAKAIMTIVGGKIVFNNY